MKKKNFLKQIVELFINNFKYNIFSRNRDQYLLIIIAATVGSLSSIFMQEIISKANDPNLWIMIVMGLFGSAIILTVILLAYYGFLFCISVMSIPFLPMENYFKRSNKKKK